MGRAGQPALCFEGGSCSESSPLLAEKPPFLRLLWMEKECVQSRQVPQQRCASSLGVWF